jgi:DNA invertase Pin-like site-specific DNA recombinase
MSKRGASKNRRSAPTVRCAIYTRKSSEEGLEQDFNSLDAQREACEAFILSQKHAGWDALSAMYDDGGVSGATMGRPALQRLLDDVLARKIDVVVVYKVDRLTRSLADFAKIVEIFDADDVSFVSVTQQFNTTTSMGRLTLNVLLSFAQFEREVTGERIRDKIAASKRKGMWMGGLPPLGYDVRDRKLVVNEKEAETVRHIHRRYAELGSVRLLKHELDADGVVSKVRRDQNGRRWGGKPLARGAFYLMLQNRIYLGEIVHKDKSYPGEHEAIIDQELWEAVQTKLKESRVERTNGGGAGEPSLLAGLLYDNDGNRMTPSHAVKDGKRYRYYVSRPLVTHGRSVAPAGQRIPAGEVERLVADRVRAFLASEGEIHGAIEAYTPDCADQLRLIERAAGVAKAWGKLSVAERRSILRGLIARIDVSADRIDLHLVPSRLADLLRRDPLDLPVTAEAGEDDDRLTLSIPARIKRAGLGTRMIIPGERSAEPDASLIKTLIKAHELRDKLLSGDGASIAGLARREGVGGSYFTRLLRLTFLAPDIVKDILDGRHPPTVTATQLLKDTRLPLDWGEQRAALGFAGS